MADVAAPTGPSTTAPATGGVPLIPTPEATRATNDYATTVNSGNAMLVTSGPARTATAANITKLQTITQPPTSPAVPVNPSQNQLDNRTSSTGIQTANGTKGTYSLDTSGNVVDANGSVIASKDQSGAYSSVKNSSGQMLTGVDANGNLQFGSASATPTPPNATQNPPDGTSTDPYDQATGSITDPGLRAQFKSTLKNLDSQISAAQSTLQQAQATAVNDPAAAAAIAGIQRKFEQQIALMKDKNTQVLGKFSSAAGAFGGLGVMSQNFLNDEQSRADARISDLVAKEEDAITKAQIAYQTNDMKALNTAMSAYDAANKSKLQALNDLLTSTNKQVTEMQAQQKIDAAAEKQAVTLDISKSANLGAAIAKNLADSGITDPQQMQDYVAGIAKEYGITNPDILMSAVTKAQQAAGKAADTHANVVSEINNRDKPKGAGKPKKDGEYSYTPEDVNLAKDFLKDPSKKGYGKAGTDGYSDPGAYVGLMNSWLDNKGTIQGFAKEFPPKKYLNPASYNLIPEAIRPKTAAATPYTTN